jgi:GNAT superfamily N-acetyltransferase
MRPARPGDLPAIVAMLADDPLGATRESPGDLAPYRAAFERIDTTPGQLLVVAEADGGRVVGTLQLSILPGLSRRGASRALIEAVRVHADERGAGLGTRLVMARHELSVSEDSPQVRRLVVTGCPHVAHLDLIYARVAASWWLAVCPRRSPEILMCSPCSPRASLSSHHHRKQKTSDDGAQEYAIRPRPPPSRGRGCYVGTRERRRILFPDTIGLG